MTTMQILIIELQQQSPIIKLLEFFLFFIFVPIITYFSMSLMEFDKPKEVNIFDKENYN